MLLLGEKMLKENSIRVQFSCYKNKSTRIQNSKYPPPPYLEFSKELPIQSTSLFKPMTKSQNIQYGKL